MSMLAENLAGDVAHAGFSLRSCIQKVATGPEYSKDLSYEEALAGMRAILNPEADPVQAAVYLVALRMKRETDAENKGTLQAIIEASQRATAPVDDVIDVADPYDGYDRGIPASPFLPPLLAACGLPAVSHGLESVGPKNGVTHHRVLRAAGIDVGLQPEAAAANVGNPDIGWSYVDQASYCAPLHDLVSLRSRIVKRPVLTTVETLVGPIRGRSRTHLLTGYVHEAYPAIYAELARHAGFDSALIVRGVEGGVIPSLKQPARIYGYRELGPESAFEVEPGDLEIARDTRAVPVPAEFHAGQSIDAGAAAAHAADLGIRALEGESGPTRDALVYATALCLHHLGRADTLRAGAEIAREKLDSGAALARLHALRDATGGNRVDN